MGPPHPTPPSAETWAEFRRQESTLILLNLGVLAALVLIHLLFRPVVGDLSPLAYVLIFGRFLMQSVELLLLAGRTWPESAAAARAYGIASILANVVFAFALSVLAEIESSHYIVLMVIPIIAAAARLRATGMIAVVALAGALAFVEVSIYYRHHPPAEPTEYFEAATVALVYAVVALVARGLFGQLRDRQRRLEAGLDELRATQTRLVAEEKLAAVGRLAGAIAHEIRNPVAMIASSLRRAARDDAGAERRARMFEIAAQESAHLERLTEEFLAFARVRPPARKPLAPCHTLGCVADLCRARAEERGVLLETHCAADDPVALDAGQIHQALLNLVTNAIDAAPAGSTVRLEARRDGPRVVFAVADAGPPIPPEVASRLFEPFFTTKAQGTGLGLAISRRIAEAHDGTLRLAGNDADGVRFELALPGFDGAGGAGENGGDGADPDRR